MWSKYKLLLICPLCLLLGLFLGWQLNKSPEADYQETHHQLSNKNYQYTSPLLACGNPASNNLSGLKKKVIDTINKQQTSHISVYFRDLNNGPWFGINENENFSPASLVKVPLAIAYYKQLENDPNFFNRKILNTQQDNNPEQNIKPEQTIAPNQEYSIEELIKYMIVYSDNNAYELLVNNLPSEILVDTYTDLGIDISKAFTNPSGNIISVKNYSSFFRILYNSSYLSQKNSNYLLSLLTQTTYRPGLVAGVNNQQIAIAHKFGERRYLNTGELQLHDCGIVYYPQKPYLICIMTRGKDIESLNRAIKDISSTVYQYWKNI